MGSLEQCVLRLKQILAADEFITAVTTLRTIINNLINSTDAKFRALPLTNAGLNSRLLRFDDAVDLLRQLGFERNDVENKLIINQGTENPEMFEFTLKLLEVSMKAPDVEYNVSVSFCLCSVSLSFSLRLTAMFY
jgi:hypothetical protein